jgi:hypothetical protein
MASYRVLLLVQVPLHPFYTAAECFAGEVLHHPRTYGFGPALRIKSRPIPVRIHVENKVAKKIKKIKG